MDSTFTQSLQRLVKESVPFFAQFTSDLPRQGGQDAARHSYAAGLTEGTNQTIEILPPQSAGDTSEMMGGRVPQSNILGRTLSNEVSINDSFHESMPPQVSEVVTCQHDTMNV